MNYAETFEQFASRSTTTDLALYAGFGLIIYVLFKDKLSPVQEAVLKGLELLKSKTAKVVDSPVIEKEDPQLIELPVTQKNKDDLFFDLISSWKRTRDLAVKCECEGAVDVADKMFPYLSPTVCVKKDTVQ
jgi:hypothetical protein